MLGLKNDMEIPVYFFFQDMIIMGLDKNTASLSLGRSFMSWFREMMCMIVCKIQPHDRDRQRHVGDRTRTWHHSILESRAENRLSHVRESGLCSPCIARFQKSSKEVLSRAAPGSTSCCAVGICS